MSRPLRIEYPGAFYHVTSRGNERKDVFKSQNDREKFLEYLKSATERYRAVIHVYCLMSTHYHIFLETPRGNLSQIMRHINGAYTTYYNVKRKRAGHLFQGRYKAILVEADAYATELSRYVHLNPVRAGMVVRPEEYQWSSYRGYLGTDAPPWLKTEFILGYFGEEVVAARNGYRAFIEDLLDKKYENPLDHAAASAILGSQDFIEDITVQYIDERDLDQNIPGLGWLAHRPQYEEIERIVNARLMDQPELIRDVSIHCCKKYSGSRLKDIGEYFGRSDAAISQVSRRLMQRAEKNPTLKAIILAIESCFKSGGVE